MNNGAGTAGAFDDVRMEKTFGTDHVESGGGAAVAKIHLRGRFLEGANGAFHFHIGKHVENGGAESTMGVRFNKTHEEKRAVFVEKTGRKTEEEKSETGWKKYMETACRENRDGEKESVGRIATCGLQLARTQRANATRAQ